MLEFIEIKINNLASIQNQSYIFKDGLATIIGINRDTSEINSSISNEDLLKYSLINLKSNGSGKSSIIEALHICLLGSCIKEKINLRDLIRSGEKSMKIELICKNTQLGLEKIRIIREIFSDKNKTSKIEIFEQKNGEEEKQIPRTSSEGMDNYILNHYIGLSKEDIDNFFIIQRDKFKSFLSLSDQRKKEILARFTGISNFSFVEDNLKQEIEDYSQQVIEINNNISEIEGKISSYQDIISEVIDEKTFEIKKKEKISELEDKKENEELGIKNYKNNIIHYKKLIDNNEDCLSLWKGRKKKYEEYILINNSQIKIDKLNIERKKVEKEKSEIEEAIEEASKIKQDKNFSISEIELLKNKLEILLKNLVECPRCKFKFNPNDNKSEKDIQEDILNKENQKQKLKKELSEVISDINELKELISSKDKELLNIDTQISCIRMRNVRITKIGEYIYDKIHKIELENKKIDYDIQSFEKAIENCNKNIEDINEKIKEIQKEQYTSIISNIEKYKKQLKKLNLDKKEIELNKKKVESNIQLSKDSLLNYGLFKNYLYNKIIAEIEYIVNSYLSKFSDLSVQIKGNKVLVDGKSIREEINCLINRKGQEISYFLLSSGEKAFVDISFILTFQKILNTTSNNGLNFLILDEITGCVDAANQEELLQAINIIKSPILFITHIPTISDFNTTYIIKENNISKII